MKSFRQFVEHNRESSAPPLPGLPKLPRLPALPKMNVNSGPTTQKITPTQAVAQLKQIIVQLQALMVKIT